MNIFGYLVVEGKVPGVLPHALDAIPRPAAFDLLGGARIRLLAVRLRAAAPGMVPQGIA